MGGRWEVRLVPILAVVSWFLLFTGVQIVTGFPSWIVLMTALLVGGVLMAVIALESIRWSSVYVSRYDNPIGASVPGEDMAAMCGWLWTA